jgi:hypothetical protein
MIPPMVMNDFHRLCRLGVRDRPLAARDKAD